MGVSEGGGKIESIQKRMLVERGVFSRDKKGFGSKVSGVDGQKRNCILVLVSVTIGYRGSGSIH